MIRKGQIKDTEQGDIMGKISLLSRIFGIAV